MNVIHKISVSILVLFFAQISLAATVTETWEGTVSFVGDNPALVEFLSLGDTINWGITYEIPNNTVTQPFEITSVDLSEINTLLTSAGLVTSSLDFGFRDPNNFNGFVLSLGDYDFFAGADAPQFGAFFQTTGPFIPSQLFALTDVMILGSVTVPSAVPIPATVWLFGSCLIGLAGMRRKI
jgi:hypothetical protein